MSFFFFAVSVCENKAALARLYFFFRHIHRSPREGCGCACAKVCVRLSVCVCLLACSRQKKNGVRKPEKSVFLLLLTRSLLPSSLSLCLCHAAHFAVLTQQAVFSFTSVFCFPPFFSLPFFFVSSLRMFVRLYEFALHAHIFFFVQCPSCCMHMAMYIFLSFSLSAHQAHHKSLASLFPPLDKFIFTS